LGNIQGGNAAAGTLFKSLQERPLSSILKTLGYMGADDPKNARKRLFVTDFIGDVTASQVDDLREEVTGILRSAQPGDEVLLILQTGGGTVTGYGLGAAQLERFKKSGIKLTVCVEQVAASGGYLMSCVADKIIASPFAVLGSIGVVSDMPNVYNRLQREGM
jgi:serine protease SohB